MRPHSHSEGETAARPDAARTHSLHTPRYAGRSFSRLLDLASEPRDFQIALAVRSECVWACRVLVTADSRCENTLSGAANTSQGGQESGRARVNFTIALRELRRADTAWAGTRAA